MVCARGQLQQHSSVESKPNGMSASLTPYTEASSGKAVRWTACWALPGLHSDGVPHDIPLEGQSRYHFALFTFARAGPCQSMFVDAMLIYIA